MADEAPILIRLGAALDSSIEKSFATVEDRANRAALATAQAAAKGGKESTAALDREWNKQLAALNKVAAQQDKLYERNAKYAAQEASKAARASEQASDRSARAAERAAGREAAAAERAARARQKASDRAASASLRGFEQIARAARTAEVAEHRSSSRGLDRFATRTSRYAVRAAIPYIPLAQGARRLASELARGVGVDFNFGSAVARNVERESAATALSNSGYQENTAGPNGQRVAASTLDKEARTIGNNAALDPTKVLEAERGFVGITGNLDQARQMGGELAKITKATSANAEDVWKAAAKINAQMADTPAKAEETLAVVRLLAGQGKLGAAEMKDYAKSIGQVAGTAHRFKGDVTTNIGQLSAMAQQSIQSGFSKSPVQAATGVASFANTLSKGARVKEFTALGIHPENLTPMQIIQQSLLKTKGDNLAMGKLFADSRSRALTLPYEQIFNTATGGRKDPASLEAGAKAVEAAFARLTQGAMSETEIDKEFAAQLSTTSSKAQRFQNKLDEVAQRVEAKLLPALEKLEGPVLKLADFLGNVVGTAVDHPKAAIATAILGSTGLAAVKAGAMGLGELGIVAVGRRLGFGGAAGAAAGAAEGAGAAGAAGAAGGLLGVAGRFLKPTVLGRNVGMMGFGLAAGAATAGVMAADDQNDRLKKETGGMGALDIIGGMLSQGTFDPMKVVDKHLNEQAKTEAAKPPGGQTGEGDISLKSFSDQQTADNEALRREVISLRQTIASGTLNVRLTNPPDAPPGAPVPGRASQR